MTRFYPICAMLLLLLFGIISKLQLITGGIYTICAKVFCQNVSGSPCSIPVYKTAAAAQTDCNGSNIPFVDQNNFKKTLSKFKAAETLEREALLDDRLRPENLDAGNADSVATLADVGKEIQVNYFMYYIHIFVPENK